MTAATDGQAARPSPAGGLAASRPGRICAATQTYARTPPPSCLCIWSWQERLGKYTLEAPFPGCPWHEGD